MRVFKPCYNIEAMDQFANDDGTEHQESELYNQAIRVLKNLGHLELPNSTENQVFMSEYDCFNQIMAGIIKSYESRNFKTLMSTIETMSMFIGT
jgi:hypothetical protein